MTTKQGSSVDEAQIRALIEERVAAVHAKDAALATAHHAPDVLAFDVVNPLRYTESSAVRERTEQWFASYRSSIGCEVRDLRVTAGDDVAFCHYVYRVTGTLTIGQEIEMWVRATVCCRKIDGAWTVTHEHQSVPFDPESGRASLDLKP